MNPGITEWLSEEQIQTFDADSINKMIEKYKATKELVEQDFDIDNNVEMSTEELAIYKKLEENWDIINSLENLLIIISSKKEVSLIDMMSWNQDSIKQSILPQYELIDVEFNKNMDELITTENAKKDTSFSKIEEGFFKYNRDKILKYIYTHPNKLKILVENWIFSINMCSDSEAEKMKKTYIEIVKNEIEEEINKLRWKDWKFRDKDNNVVEIKDIFELEWCKPIVLNKKLSKIVWPNNEKLDFARIKWITIQMTHIKELKNENKISGILLNYNINIEELKDKSSSEIFIILKNKKLKNNEINKVIELIWKNNTIKNSRDVLVKTNNIKDAKEAIINLETNNELDKYIIENSEKFLNVVNELNLFHMQITDIDLIINWTDYLYTELMKHKNLSQDAEELLSILYAKIYTTNDINTLKGESNKSIISTDELEKQINSYYETEADYSKKNIIKHWFEVSTINSQKIIKTISWDNIDISEKEAKLIESNPETAKNIINFYKALNELWLNNLWKHRESISNSIWSQSWASINNNDNSLSENELKIFLNSILSSVWEEKINISWNINQFKNEFKNKNKVQVSWNYKDNLEIWSSDIEEKFMKKYITWFSKFQTSSFLKNIK